MSDKELLQKIENIDELKDVLSAFFNEFERIKDNFKEGKTRQVYDKYENTYHTYKMSDDEIDDEARENLINDNSGWFDDIILSTEVNEKLCDLFRKIARGKYNL